jgi:SAM-dependent methyltransferase
MMDEAEFDKFADEYLGLHAQNIRASGESPQFFAEYKIADTAELLAERGRPKNLRILDLGSGIGVSVPFFRRHFPSADLVCLDVSRKSLDIGRKRFPNEARFVHFDGATIPFPDGSFDLVFTACVFHHIDHAEHVALLSEVRRVLADTGTFVVFEHNPLNPLTVHAVNTCVFDEHAKLIPAGQMLRSCGAAGFGKLERRYRIFFPGPLRRLRPLERYLRWLPLGAQYFVAAEK